MISNRREFNFSIIIPIYNTEEYLEEAIDSIIGQTIGFKDNVQLILINDGSTDSSEQICLNYRNKYPDNIVYKYKKNGGVSSACNLGLDFVCGKYVNFCGSDDKWGEHSLEAVYQFMEKHYDEIDMVSCRVIRFGSKTGKHPLDFKYEKTRVIDLNEKPDYVQLTDGNCFFKREVFEEKRLNEDLHYEEDALFIGEVLIEKLKYGVVKEAELYYRTRDDGTSLVQKTIEDKGRYLVSPKYFMQRLFEISKNKYGRVIPFIQYTVMYEMQWRFTEKLPENMIKEEIDVYYNILYELLQDIDDEVIYKQRHMNYIKKAYALKMKNGSDFFNKVRWEEGVAYNKADEKVYDFKRRKRFEIFTTNIIDNFIEVRGLTDIGALGIGFELYAQDSDGKKYYAKMKKFPKRDVISFTGDNIFDGTSFLIKLPVTSDKSYQFYVKLDNAEETVLQPLFGIFSRLNNRYAGSYFIDNKYIINYRKNKIGVFKYSKKMHLISEIRCLRGINKQHEKSAKIIAYHILCNLLKPFSKKKIWIVSDRLFKAGDNGENFFKYAVKRKESADKKIYFLIEKNCEDYKRIRKYGKVLSPYSLKYKILFLMSDKIISSHADAAVVNPFGSNGHLLNTLFNFDYVYLQHGVLPGDLSGWLNILNKNMRLFVASTRREYDSIINGYYGYSNREVALAGMTRHDALGITPIEKTVVFLPTWREKLAGKIMTEERNREYVENFSDNYYCKFYNSLINDERLIAAFKKFGYKGEFYVHPSFHKQTKDFIGNDTIKVGEQLADYEDILNKAALMITDYSSVAFDFGYQRKPIIYCQFDSDTWNENHFYNKGYFDYEKDGFGPVAYDLDSTVNYIIESLSVNCKIDDKYKKRADEFFEYDDHNNCKRVYEEILKID